MWVQNKNFGFVFGTFLAPVWPYHLEIARNDWGLKNSCRQLSAPRFPRPLVSSGLPRNISIQGLAETVDVL